MQAGLGACAVAPRCPDHDPVGFVTAFYYWRDQVVDGPPGSCCDVIVQGLDLDNAPGQRVWTYGKAAWAIEALSRGTGRGADLPDDRAAS